MNHNQLSETFNGLFAMMEDTENGTEPESEQFSETDAGQAFRATGNARQTSGVVMDAIATHARNLSDAESLWAGHGIGDVASLAEIWVYVAANGWAYVTDINAFGPDGFYWAGKPVSRLQAIMAVMTEAEQVEYLRMLTHRVGFHAAQGRSQ